MKSSIPTMYRGVRFRSRLEAKWAVFFDLVGWPWLYEPLDLRGYVPDFVLRLHADVLVEVKPAFGKLEMAEATQKIDRSGWGLEAIVVGVGPSVIPGELDDTMFPTLGLLRESPPDTDAEWSTAQIMICQNCRRPSFFHASYTWNCRVSGCYDGDHYLGDVPSGYVQRLWSQASNHVQWRGMVDAPDIRGNR